MHSNEVSVLDLTNLRLVENIPVGKEPVQVGFLPDGKQVYVSLSGEDSVAVIDTATRQVVDKIAVGRSPIQLFSTPDSRKVYVANQGRVGADKAATVPQRQRGEAGSIRTGYWRHN